MPVHMQRTISTAGKIEHQVYTQWLYLPGGARHSLLDVVPLQMTVPPTETHITFLPVLDYQEGAALQSSQAAIARASRPPEEGYRQAFMPSHRA